MGEFAVTAIATPPGKGGIACVRISGEGAHQIADKVFCAKTKGKTISSAAGYTALYGHFLRGGKVKDECVALVFRGPKSYTGEDVAELSCHGGSAVANELLSACIEAGAQPAGPGEFTKRAFLNGRISLTQAEGVMEMIEATSRQGAAAAAAALDGALYRRLSEKCLGPLTALIGQVAAFTDFPDEEVPELAPEELGHTLAAILKETEALISSYDTGAILRRGVETAIVGSPNVGKSTLLNLLSGYERAIVTPVPGTTRDVVEQSVSIGGIELLLADTAGIRETEDLVEREGIRRSYERIDRAGLILAVFDGSSFLSEEDRELARHCKGRAALAVVNKSDLPSRFPVFEIEECFKAVITISAKDPAFLQEVEKGVLSVLGVAEADPDAGLLANARQLAAAQKAKSALADALEALRAGFTLDAVGVCADDALAAFYELSGENATEAVVEEVFSKFCVGK